MSDKIMSPWICCQLGAREHYAIPRALNLTKQLVCLITDAWLPDNSIVKILPKSLLTNLRERFHNDLAQLPIYAFTNSLIGFELFNKTKNKSGWELTITRNYWFQDKAIESLKSITDHINCRPTLFTYSYAALNILRFAKSQGWRTILGQIDPGPVEEQLVLKEHAKHPEYQSNWQSAPSEYWNNWQQECALADRIIVNSFWSSQALQKVGIPAHKINIVPLAYQTSKQAYNFTRTYPVSFSFQRPLRVLFLGQVILRKGIAALLEAAEILHDQPIEFWIVGNQGIIKAPRSHSRVRWIGAVSRSTTAMYYQTADVFLFPTLSDGFGLTQLEAQAWKLPIIASKFCGDVVKDHINGLLLNEVTGLTIAETLLFCLNNPQHMETFSRQAMNINNFSLSKLCHQLQALPFATSI